MLAAYFKMCCVDHFSSLPSQVMTQMSLCQDRRREKRGRVQNKVEIALIPHHFSTTNWNWNESDLTATNISLISETWGRAYFWISFSEGPDPPYSFSGDFYLTFRKKSVGLGWGLEKKLKLWSTSHQSTSPNPGDWNNTKIAWAWSW